MGTDKALNKKQMAGTWRAHVMLVLAPLGLVLTVTACDTGRQSERPATAGRLGRVRSGCDLITAATRAETAAEPRTTDPGGPGVSEPRCTVDLRMDLESAPAGAEPSEEIRLAFARAGWTKDLDAAADGAGTTAFAYRKSDVRCEVSGGRPASLVDGEIVEDGYIYLDADCFAADLDGAAAPTR
jgi:hypothetical protein